MRGTVGRVALTLVEVLVALAVLAVNVLGWAGAVQLLVMLARVIAVLTAPTDVDDVVLLCALAVLTPWRVPRARQCGSHARSHAHGCGRRGLTLVEVIIVLAVGAMTLGIVTMVATSTMRVSRDVQYRTEAHVVGAALPALLAEVVQPAGRGLDDGSCGFDVTEAGERLIIRSVGLYGVLVVDELFAARDASGRPALYLRRVPHSRQPWIEDVTRFRVVDVVEDGEGRAMRVDVEVERHGPEQHYVFDLGLPHRPCVGSAP